jgi:tetratricopeptide (TPR) repeat protein
LKGLFDRYYPDSSPAALDQDPRGRATRAYAHAVGEFGEFCLHVYQNEGPDIIEALAIEEPNLLHAKELAKSHEWWNDVIKAMQGLFVLYDHKGRWAEFERLVNGLVPCFVDQETEGPLPGRESEWRNFTSYRVRLMQEARNWEEAAKLQLVAVDWERKPAAPYLQSDPVTLDGEGRSAIRSLAVSLNELGLTERECGKPECFTRFEEAIDLFARIKDNATEALAYLNAGVTHLTMQQFYDLDKAEKCLRRGYELTPETHQLQRSKCLSELGFISLERFKQAVAAKQPDSEALAYLNDARSRYELALSLTPPDALTSICVKHSALGEIYATSGFIDQSMNHYSEAIRICEDLPDSLGAGKMRLGASRALFGAGRLLEARDYAQAALDNFVQCKAGEFAQHCREFIAQLVKEINSKGV